MRKADHTRIPLEALVFALGIAIGIAASVLGETRLIPPIGTTQPMADSLYVNVTGDTMTGPLVLPSGAEPAPSLTGPDSDSGIFWANAGQDIWVTRNGARQIRVTASGVFFDSSLYAEDPVSIGDDAYFRRDVNAGLTASTTQSQGQGALTAEVNEVATCANDNDTVTLPVAVVGRTVMVVNNGAKTLQIFPASGDDLGAGVDTSTTLSSGDNVTYQAYDTTNWEPM
jgi:hypothetical protein